MIRDYNIGKDVEYREKHFGQFNFRFFRDFYLKIQGKPFILSEHKNNIMMMCGGVSDDPNVEFERMKWFYDACDTTIYSLKHCLVLKHWLVEYIDHYKDLTLNKLPIEEIKIEKKVKSLITGSCGVIGDVWEDDNFRDGPRTVVKIYWFNDNISVCHLETDCDVIVFR